MKLYATIQDRTSNAKEHVVLCQFNDKDDTRVFVEAVENHNVPCFKVLLDEGYSRTYYLYPVEKYSITHIEKYEE